jgi:hypothetical protein
MGKALLAYASPKAALTWASTFSDREAPAGAAPASSTRRPALGSWIATALVVLGAAGTLVWGTMRAPAPLTIETPSQMTTRPAMRPRIVIPAEAVSGARAVERTPRPRR